MAIRRPLNAESDLRTQRPSLTESHHTSTNFSPSWRWRPHGPHRVPSHNACQVYPTRECSPHPLSASEMGKGGCVIEALCRGRYYEPEVRLQAKDFLFRTIRQGNFQYNEVLPRIFHSTLRNERLLTTRRGCVSPPPYPPLPSA